MATGRAWTWRLEDGSLCNWAEAQKEFLYSDNRPSPGAKRVYVRLVPNREWLRLNTMVTNATSHNKAKPSTSSMRKKRTAA